MLARRRAALSAAAACCSGFHSSAPAAATSNPSPASKVASSPLANWAVPAAAAAAFLGWAAFLKEDGGETKEKRKEAKKDDSPSAAKCEEASPSPSLPPHPPPRRPDLPLYKRADVARHNQPGDVWVTRGDGVYDVSEFVAGHPGGPARLMLAAGGAIDPFWAIYAQHDTGQVREILEGYWVGTLVSFLERAGRDKDCLPFFNSLRSKFLFHFFSTSASTYLISIISNSEKKKAPGEAAPPAPDFDDPYGSDPQRHPAIRVVTAKPFNGETPAATIPGSLLTPNELFYVRNHLPVPLVKGAAASGARPFPAELAETANDDWKVQVLGLDPSGPALELTVRDLKSNFEKVVIPATLQCSGNRRNELSREVKPVKGLEWDSGAISTAAWGGARLSDVLEAAGVTQGEALKRGKKHVCFDGGDVDGGSLNEALSPSSPPPTPPPPGYGASIPSRRAFDRNADVILAYEMNGKPLPRDHGAPVRVVVPGVTAARSVKWLTRVALSEDEHESHFQRKDYRTFAPGTDWDNVDWDSSPSILETNVNSAILEPLDGTKLTDGPYLSSEGAGALTVRGWAFSGGGRGIQRVDFSLDGGETWTPAQTLERVPGDGDGFENGPAWCWTLWTAEDVKLPESFKGTGEVEILARAVDSSCNVQPEKPGPIWNLRGACFFFLEGGEEEEKKKEEEREKERGAREKAHRSRAAVESSLGGKNERKKLTLLSFPSPFPSNSRKTKNNRSRRQPLGAVEGDGGCGGGVKRERQDEL